MKTRCDRQTDRPTEMVTYRAAIAAKNMTKKFGLSKILVYLAPKKGQMELPILGEIG